MHEKGQAAKASSRETQRDASTSADESRIPQALRCCEKSRCASFRICEKEIDLSGTPGVFRRRTPLTHKARYIAMQAPQTLSPLQKDALEKSYITLRVLSVFLESIAAKLQEPDDRLLARVNKDSAEICRRHLLTAFPILHLAEGGVR